MSEDPDIEDLRSRTETGSRIEQQQQQDDETALEAGLVRALTELEEQDIQKTVSVWDGEVAALMLAMSPGTAVWKSFDEEQREVFEERREDLGDTLAEILDVDVETYDRSTLLRMALRAGLERGDSELMKTLQEAALTRQARHL